MIREELGELAVDIKKLQLHPKNVRQGDVGLISQSLEAHGQYRPIVVQKSTGFILAGNHTFKAAKALGWKKIAATFVDCDDEAALRILLTDNKAADAASYDDKALAELLQELASTEDGLKATMYSGDDLDDLLFQLNGTLNNTWIGEGTDNMNDKAANSDQRSIVLPYKIQTYNEIVKKLSDLSNVMGVETFTEVIKQLVDSAYAELD